MPVRILKEFLDRQRVKYVSITHSAAYTAQEIAAAAHVPGRNVAKTVMVWLDGKLAMAVVPANCKVVLEDLREATGTRDARFATEEEFKARFPDCEVGAMPPFGHLYGMDTCVAAKLAEDDEIAFNAGSHTELIKLSYRDFDRLEKPKVGAFST